MRIHELTAGECEEVLARSDLGRLACAHDNQPYIVPILFSFDASRRCLFAFSAIGRKIEWMRENPKVCVEVDDVADKANWTSVVVFGHYHELRDSPGDAAARHVALDLLSRRGDWWFPGAAVVGAREPSAIVLYRIDISRVSGRRAAHA